MGTAGFGPGASLLGFAGAGIIDGSICIRKNVMWLLFNRRWHSLSLRSSAWLPEVEVRGSRPSNSLVNWVRPRQRAKAPRSKKSS